MTKQETIVRTIAQVIGGVAVFRLIQVLWGIEIAETHVGRSHSAIYNVCTADLAGEGVLSMISMISKGDDCLKKKQISCLIFVCFNFE